MISACWHSNPPSGSMAPEQLTAGAGAAYVDRLTSAAARGMVAAGVLRIIVIERLTGWQKMLAAKLKMTGVAVEELQFFAGDIRTTSDESIHLASWRLAGELAFEASRSIIARQPLLNRLNAGYRKEAIRLSLAKNLTPNIQYVTQRVQLAQALSHPARAEVWLAEPTLFDGSLLAKHFPDTQLRFYPTPKSRVLLLIKEIALTYARHVKRQLGGGAYIPEQLGTVPSVLMVQEDNIRFDRSLRGQPHWLGVNGNSPWFNSYIANLSPGLAIAGDDPNFSKSALSLVFPPTLRASWRNRKAHPFLHRLANDRREVLRAAFVQPRFSELAALLYVSRLLLEAERMGALAAWLNISVFLVRETYMVSADAMELVASDLNITSIAYQYSNMGARSPLMMSTADDFVIFSEMYKDVFCGDGIGPKNWIIGGYIYDGIADIVRNRASTHRTKLRGRGAKFIVCYFDESVEQHGRWSLISKSGHLAELHVLAKAVLDDPTFAVVLKSQFMRNSPSQLYPEDDLIQGAKATGRFLELLEGKWRNDIYPTEAALVADLCISQKFGATAALEAAVAGVHTVLVNRHGAKTLLDDVYAKAEIVFDSIESVMSAIATARASSVGMNQLGNWSSILKEFDPYQDGAAVSRLRTQVEAHLTAPLFPH